MFKLKLEFLFSQKMLTSTKKPQVLSLCAVVVAIHTFSLLSLHETYRGMVYC